MERQLLAVNTAESLQVETEAPGEWDQPTKYELWYASPLGQAYAASLGQVLRPWLAECAGLRVADIGCGPGLENWFPPEADVVGVDCSFKMARRAWWRSRQRERAGSFVVGSVERLPLDDACLDLLFCVNCLEFVRNRDAAFREMARVLHPGATAILGVLNRHSLWELTRRLRRPLSHSSYYEGRFFRAAELVAHVTDVGLVVEELHTAVHFPPFLANTLSTLYRWWDQRSQQRGSRWGGVILCRAVKQP